MENPAGMHTDLCCRIVIGKKKIASRRIIFWRIVFEAPFGATYDSLNRCIKDDFLFTYLAVCVIIVIFGRIIDYSYRIVSGYFANL